MHKLWLIVGYEYERHVLKRSFLLGTLSVPLAMVIAVVASAVVRSLAGAPAGSPGELPSGPTAGQLLPALFPAQSAEVLQTQRPWVLSQVAPRADGLPVQWASVAHSTHRLVAES